MDAATPPCAIEETTTVWRGRFPLQTVRFRYRRFDGAMSGTLTWEVWRRGQAAAVLPYHAATDRVLLIEQFRLPAHLAGMAPVLLEVPAGMIAEEGAEACARREAEEEAGITLGRIEPIGTYLLSPGGSDERIVLFAGEVLAAPPAGIFGLADEHEDIRLCPMPAEAAVAAAFDGRVTNATTALALAWLAQHRARLRAAWSTA